MDRIRQRLFAGLVVVSVVASLFFLPARAARSQSDTEQGLDLLRAVFDLIQYSYVDQVPMDQVVRGAIDGAVAALGDPYSQYFNTEEFQAFNESLEGAFGGIGAQLDTVDGYVVIVAVLKDTPAEAAGLRAGDRILAADGVDLVGAAVQKAVSVIRGEPGTVVRLRIERPSEGRTFDIEITRGLIQIKSIETELLSGNIGLVRIGQFNDDAVRGFRQAVADFRAMGVAGLIIDLRDDPGGYLQSVIDIAQDIVPSGEIIVQTVDRTGQRESEISRGQGLGLPLAVLVNGGTASASEILAGAVQDLKLGTLVGTQTFGKGSVQTIWTFSGGAGGIKLTTARYLTPSGRSIDGTGLTPDVVVPEPKPVSYEPIVIERTVQSGQVGLDVLAFEQRMRELGLRTGPVDGIFDVVTERGLREFQRNYGFRGAETGLIDKDSAFLMNSYARRQAERRNQQAGDPQLEAARALLLEQISRGGR